MLKLTSAPVVALALALSAPAQDANQSQTPQIGYKSAADAGQRKTLLLKDFKPTSMLHAPVHKVERAKFYVIDVHNHVNDAQSIEEPIPPQRVIEVMDNTNVRTVVILTGMWVRSFRR